MRYIPDWIVFLFDKSPYFLRSLASSTYGLLKTVKERNVLFYKCLNELQETQWSDEKKIKDIQLERLKKIYSHAYHTVPFYSDLYNKNGLNEDSIHTLSNIKKLPIITKEDIRVNYHQMISIKSPRLQMIAQTSGTTGKPLRIHIDRRSEAYHNAIMKFMEKIADCNKGWHGVLAGYKILPTKRKKPPFWMENIFDRQIHYSSYHLNKNTFGYYESHMHKRKVRYLRGYPTAIGTLAKFILDAGRTLELDAVFTSSQSIQKWTRDAIEKVFKCKIYDFYAQVEHALWAISCSESDNLHIISPLSIVEFNPDFVAGKYNITVTNLVNYRMPLIRYELDDLTVPIYNKLCACGRSWQQITPIESRKGDFIITPSGRTIPAPSFTIAFWGVDGIIEAQVHQINMNTIIVRLIPAIDYEGSSGDTVIKRIQSIVGDGMDVRLELCENLLEGNTGKRQFILRTIDA